MRIHPTAYKDIEAIACETSALRALFLPEHGGKCASLRFVENGRELLAQADSREYRRLAYAGKYVDAECSAFDDMFPTIDEAYCAQFPWQGVAMPDHGEVCGLPWRYEIEDDVLHMWVHSLRFAYRLDKWIGERDGDILMRYEARNLGPYDFDFVYNAHCMLAAEEGARLVLPFPDGSPCTMVFSATPGLGGYGARAAWPNCAGLDLRLTPAKSGETGYKLFFDDRIPEGWCRYEYRDGTALEVTFDPARLPYFALWVNYGSFKGMYNVAIEPGTAAFDRPDIAKYHGKASTLPGNGTYEWAMRFGFRE